ncbi:MAG: lipocalin-like domain-containing protein [Deltaproteobacteria bacterium]|jgi:predicted secreted hydrolase
MKKRAWWVGGLCLSALGLWVGLSLGLASEGFLQALEPRALAFPRDHSDHPGFQTEWWYYTGNLVGKGGRPFGFQLTFFRVQLKPGPPASDSAWRANALFFAHFTVTDVARKTFLVAEKSGRGAKGIAGVYSNPSGVRVFLHGWETLIREKTHQLRARSDQFGIGLKLVSQKPPVLHGEKGLSRKGVGPGQASYYYSLTRMDTQGTLRVGQETFEVTGLSWMDHEFTSNVLSKDQEGWDWMSLQLSDGSELMFYVLRHQDGSSDPYSSGTLIRKDGTWVHLPKEAFAIRVTSYWDSPRSQGRYPSSWQVAVLSHGMSLEVTPRLRDQELITQQSTGVTYWEGSVRVAGTVAGQRVTGSGYVELTGYAEGFDPAFQGF